jgi:hypothetical protein
MGNPNKKVESIRINGQVTKEVLLELGTDPNLEGYMILCRWKGNGYSVGWSDMNEQKLAHGLAYMDHQIKRELFGDM